jgi:pimeloyl-ACP methyl ester carboxylesterase
MSVTRSAEQTAYRSAGAGPPELLLLHGWAGSGAYFHETIAALDLEHLRATTLDLAGHGESAAGDGDWSLDRIDDAILSVADAIGARRSIVLGFSMAGKFAQHFALRHPDRVTGLILVAGTQAASMTLPSELLGDWYGRAGSADAIKELIRSFLTGPVDEAALDRFASEGARIPRAALEGSLQTTLASDFSSDLAALDVPTLVVAGGRDELFTVELLRDTIVSRVRGARMAIVDCGHEVPLERPRELAALIEAFLAGLSSGRL